MTTFSQSGRQLGTLSRLVDDILRDVLCYCDTIDLLHVEQTCKYLRLVVTNRDIWLAVLRRLPPELTPGIAPYQKCEETDFRELAIKAMRGHRNWTSEHPKPLRVCRLNVLQPKEMWSNVRLLPGGRYMIYFLKGFLYCFDIARDAYVLECELHGIDLFSSVYNMDADGTSIYAFLVSMSAPRSGPPSAAIIDFLKIDLNLGKAVPPHRISLEWSDLDRAAGVSFIALSEPSADKDILFVPFVAKDTSSGNTRRGGILIDTAKRLVLLLSLGLGDYNERRMSHVRIANNKLFYMTGGMGRIPTIHAVSFSRFDRYWRKISEPSTWIDYEVNHAHGICFTLADISSTAPVRIGMMINPPTWLDIEKAYPMNAAAASLSLINVEVSSSEISSGMASSNSGPWTKMIYLQFSENTFPPGDEFSGQFSLERETLVFHNRFFKGHIVSGFYPTRQGRMVAHNSNNTKIRELATSAVTLLPGSFLSTTLAHLNKKRVRHLATDFYTSTLVFSRSSKDPNPTKRELVEFVVEYYD